MLSVIKPLLCPLTRAYVTNRPVMARKDAAAAAARELRRVRTEALPKLKGGLRALYRTLELSGANPLKDAHTTLAAARIERHERVIAPGLPPGFPKPEALVTGDCSRAAALR